MGERKRKKRRRRRRRRNWEYERKGEGYILGERGGERLWVIETEREGKGDGLVVEVRTMIRERVGMRERER